MPVQLQGVLSQLEVVRSANLPAQEGYEGDSAGVEGCMGGGQSSAPSAKPHAAKRHAMNTVSGLSSA